MTRVCARRIDADIWPMNPGLGVSKNVLMLMLVIVSVFALVALYANVQKLRRDKIESATFIPASSPAASPSSAASH